MRGVLTPADGFSNVQTDIGNTICRFNYAKSDAELTAKLNELAETNTHLRQWKKKPD